LAPGNDQRRDPTGGKHGFSALKGGRDELGISTLVGKPLNRSRLKAPDPGGGEGARGLIRSGEGRKVKPGGLRRKARPCRTPERLPEPEYVPLPERGKAFAKLA